MTVERSDLSTVLRGRISDYVHRVFCVDQWTNAEQSWSWFDVRVSCGSTSELAECCIPEFVASNHWQIRRALDFHLPMSTLDIAMNAALPPISRDVLVCFDESLGSDNKRCAPLCLPAAEAPTRYWYEASLAQAQELVDIARNGALCRALSSVHAIRAARPGPSKSKLSKAPLEIQRFNVARKVSQAASSWNHTGYYNINTIHYPLHRTPKCPFLTPARILLIRVRPPAVILVHRPVRCLPLLRRAFRMDTRVDLTDGRVADARAHGANGRAAHLPHALVGAG